MHNSVYVMSRNYLSLGGSTGSDVTEYLQSAFQ